MLDIIKAMSHESSHESQAHATRENWLVKMKQNRIKAVVACSLSLPTILFGP